MKIFENLLLKASGYTILILTIFYSFAAFDGSGNNSIAFSTFLTVLAFGILISVTTMILGLKNRPLFLRLILHYGSLLAAFLIVFVASGRISLETPAKIFSGVIIFTLLYSLIFASIYLIRKSVKAIDRKMDKKEKKAAYKSRYSDK